MVYLFTLTFITMAYFDYKKGIVYDSLYLPLLFYIKDYFLFLLLILLLTFLYHFIDTYIGGADLKISIIILCVYGWNWFNIWLLISVSIALMYYLITRKEEIRCLSFLQSLIW